jgi:hypothetical protein
MHKYNKAKGSQDQVFKMRKDCEEKPIQRGMSGMLRPTPCEMHGSRIDKSEKATNTKSVNGKKLDMFPLPFLYASFSLREIYRPATQRHQSK